MALIIVTGLPSSGKSELAKKIEHYIKQKVDAPVRLVSDTEHLEWEGRNIVYMSIPKEKELRGWLKSEARRYINLNEIVILDCAAYIKGFRYELFCIAKEARGHYCVVENLIDPETCWNWNKEVMIRHKDNVEPPEFYYTKETFDALLNRYEKCDNTNRWDSPLFRNIDEDRFVELLNIVTESKPLDPNKCTSLTTTSKSIFKPEKNK